MREVNFSIPNVNKASVGITTALYDRRALDCTSTLPLINSLNHLAYLTTSSARIRDILTIDGGIERLVCILKQGRSREMMEMWKWNLAFQCVVNIGVRGSESVRTRVVEADMVPVIATILDNYIRVVEKCRERADAEQNGRKKTLQSSTQGRQSSPGGRLRRHGARQNPPPAIDIPPPFLQTNSQADGPSQSSENTPIDTIAQLPALATTSPTDPTPTYRDQQQQVAHHHHHHHHNHYHHHHHHRHRHPHHHHHRSQDGRINNVNNAAMGGTRHISMQSLPGTVPSMDSGVGSRSRHAADDDRPLPILPPLQTGITSQPESPTTPSAPSIQSILHSTNTTGRNTSLLHRTNSGEIEDANADEVGSEASVSNDNNDDSMIDIQAAVEFEGGDAQETILDEVAMTTVLHPASDGREADTFDIARQSVNDGSIIDANIGPQENVVMGLPQQTQSIAVLNIMAQNIVPASQTRYLLDRTAPTALRAAMPRDEDVLMSLQLLAYVSKYCNLRSYFQQSHLVPKLKIRTDAGYWDEDSADPTPASHANKTESEENREVDEEFLLPDDFNIFPLVEKFTVKHHSHDMQHWAGVVMRNLCRKDDAKGGIRQCAYYECGRWEQFTRQFAKCRRCRRTKYCSKECQKNAWIFHRHWCQVAN